MIPRIPLSEFPSFPYGDTDVIRAYQWFKSFISDKDWEKRMHAIENHLSYHFREEEPFSEPLKEGTLLVIQKDRIGWYLYLVHTLIHEPHKYEFYQGSRVIPLFKRMGTDLELLKKIDGIEKKIKELLKKRTAEADNLLFEILTALVWARNGWRVTLLEEKKNGEKTPDILATKGGETWQIECKRQQKTSEYTYTETAKRQVLINHIAKVLLARNILLDITFHVELTSLPDTYLKDTLEQKLWQLNQPGVLVSDSTAEITASFVDINHIKAHLRRFFVKNHSPKLLELIARRPVEPTGFTSSFTGDFYYVGDGEANNSYVSDIGNAFGVHWHCDAPRAIASKSRHVGKHINDAISHFSPGVQGVIHVGMETFDGPQVEQERMKKIVANQETLDPLKSNLRWIFYHYFQAYTKPDEIWLFDETVEVASAYVVPVKPIKTHFLVIPEDSDTVPNQVHWNRPAP